MEVKLEFLPIPFKAVQDRRLARGDLATLGLIYNFTRRGNDFFMSNKVMAGNLKMSVRQVQRSLERLEFYGYIIRNYKDKSLRHRWYIETTDIVSTTSLS